MMATKTKRAPTNGSNGHFTVVDRLVLPIAPDDPPPAAAGPKAVETRSVPLERVVALGLNPREYFDPAHITELAESIRQHGLIQPIAVRQTQMFKLKDKHWKLLAKTTDGPVYELIAGECRLRACQEAGLAEIRVEVHDVDDATAATMAVMENLRRNNLNAIEEARGLQNIMQATGESQQQLGERLEHRRAQGWISNRLRLLELPEKVQQLIIQRRMPPTHAFEMLSYKAYPAVMDVLAKVAAKEFKADEGPSLRSWKTTIGHTLYGETEDVAPYCVYLKASGRAVYDVKLKLTPELREQLQVIDVPDYGVGLPRALNKTLCKKLLDEAAEAKAEKESAKAKNGAKTEPTAKQLIEKRGRQDEQTADRIRDFQVDWLRYLIAKALKGSPKKLTPTGRNAYTKLLLWMTARGSFYDTHGSREQVIEDVSKRHGGGRGNIDVAIWGVPPSRFDQFTQDCVRSLLWDETNQTPLQLVPGNICARLASDLEIDLLAAWREELCGPLSETYFNIRTKEQLQGLAKELDVYIDEGKTKGAMVKHLVSSISTKKKLPRELAKKVSVNE